MPSTRTNSPASNSRLEPLDVGHELGDDLGGRVLEREEQELAAAAAGANFLVGAEEETPAGVFSAEGREFRKLLGLTPT